MAKVKIIVNGAKVEKDKGRKGGTGSAAKQVRDKKGNLYTIRDKDFGGVTDETIRQDRQAKAGSGDSTYDGAPAPRVGGKITKSGAVASGTGSKKLMVKSIKNVKKTAASKQAKKAAVRALRGR